VTDPVTAIRLLPENAGAVDKWAAKQGLGAICNKNQASSLPTLFRTKMLLVAVSVPSRRSVAQPKETTFLCFSAVPNRCHARRRLSKTFGLSA
jgi:hypothetical protein